ncbi:MAG: HEAT repeat domain-containing protein [Candidatus Thorarchaeota archaeon]
MSGKLLLQMRGPERSVYLQLIIGISLLGIIISLLMISITIFQAVHIGSLLEGYFVTLFVLFLFFSLLYFDGPTIIRRESHYDSPLIIDYCFTQFVTLFLVLDVAWIIAMLTTDEVLILILGPQFILWFAILILSIWFNILGLRSYWFSYGLPDSKRRRVGKRSPLKHRDIKRMIRKKEWEQLIEVLTTEPNFRKREIAAETLGKARVESAVDALLQALNDDEVTVRIWAAASLIRLGNEQGRPILEEAFESEDSIKREWAAISCKGILDSRIKENLKKIQHDSVGEVRRAARTSLRYFG